MHFVPHDGHFDLIAGIKCLMIFSLMISFVTDVCGFKIVSPAV